MKLNFPALGLLVLTVAAVHVQAQVNSYKDGTPGVTGYRSEVLSEVIGQENKFTRLAEAIPAEKYSFKPTPEVRSFGEMFAHVAGAESMFCAMALGEKPPAENAVTATTKAELIEYRMIVVI